jgi:hypothetical protein
VARLSWFSPTACHPPYLFGGGRTLVDGLVPLRGKVSVEAGFQSCNWSVKHGHLENYPLSSQLPTL